jgi:hypothetical protein
MPMPGTSHRGPHFAAWALAALLVAPLAQAADGVDIRAVTGLPRAGIADAQAVAWRNIGIVAASDWLDAEVKFASCLPATTAALTPADRSGSACATSVGASAGGNRGHEFALTFKVPQWSEGAPIVDLALRSWRAPARFATPGEPRDGTVAEFVVTQPLGSVDAYLGYSTPVTQAQDASRWRSAFAGLTWYAARGTRLDLVLDRGVETSTAAIDHTLTLRLAHATAARGTRIAAWTTRALDDRSDPWQVGAGFDITF